MRGRVYSGSASFRTGPGRFASMRDDPRQSDRRTDDKTSQAKRKKQPTILQIIDGCTAKQPSKRRQAIGRPIDTRTTVNALMNACELIVSDCMHCLFHISSNTPSRRHVVTSCCGVTVVRYPSRRQQHAAITSASTPSRRRHHAVTSRVAPDGV
jgi:hypothetical protein